MACYTRLKTDIRILINTFPPTHKLFRVLLANVDEISCGFVLNRNNNETIFTINANITETYPSDPPVWFCDSDEISSIIQILSTTTGMDNYVSVFICKSVDFPMFMF